jgi:tetratricopeptide (TPR) repeat protein
MPAGRSQRSRSDVPPTIWNVPFNRNANFTGREEVLGALREGLTCHDPYQRIQAIHGLGGVGKTQVALEYAYRHRDDYAIVWWVRAEEPTTLLHDFLRLWAQMSGGTMGNAAPEVVADGIRRALDRRSDWLLVFDNAAGPYALGHVLPQGRAGHVIITSRNPNWRGMARPVQLKTWERKEAMEFLRRRTGASNDNESLSQLAEALGDLPLALEQAGACIEQAHITFADYLERFQTHRREILQVTQPAGDYPDTVVTTWEISFGKIQNASRSAADLLDLMAFLCPDEIRRELLVRGKRILPQALAATVANPVNLDGAIATLLTYSLIDATDEAITVHRLVAAVTRDRLPKAQQRRWAEVALRLVNDAFAFERIDVGTWGQCAALLPHVMATTAHAEGLGAAPEVAASLLNETGRYLLTSGQFADAQQAFERALGLARSVYGDKHPTVSTIVNDLGRVHTRLGKLDEARRYFEWALAIDEPTYGRNHPHVATVVNNYGLCLMAAGDAATAREQFEWALRIYEGHYGPSHAKVANIVNNLGYALETLGNLEEAKKHFERALGIAQSAIGQSHPTVASILHNLGWVLRSLGNLGEARSHLERAMAIDQGAYGPTHPDVMRDIDHLGQVLRDLGEVAAARAHYQRALVNVQRIHGREHACAAALQKAIDELGGAGGG